jgi:ankyrin repeat protein
MSPAVGVNPNLQNKKGETPLIKAAKMKQGSMVEELLKHEKLDATLKDNGGYTAEYYMRQLKKSS